MTGLACVVNTAVDLTPDAQMVVRRVVGELQRDGRTTVLEARFSEQKTAWNLGLPSYQFDATLPQRFRRDLLASLLMTQAGSANSCRCGPRRPTVIEPAAEAAWWDSAGGSSPDLVSHLATAGYDRVLFFDAGAPTTTACAGTAVAPEQFVVPLLVDEAQLSLSTVRRALDAATQVVATNAAEQQILESAGYGRSILDVPLRVEGDRLDPPVGGPDRDYVVVLGDWSGPSGGSRRKKAARLARLLPDVVVVVLTDEFVYPHLWPRGLDVRAATSRADLWRWFTGARATVDLEPRRFFARDIVESIMCGTPVVVPEAGVGRILAESFDGGLWYRHLYDVRTQVTALADDGLRAHLSGPAAKLARARFAEDNFRGQMATLGLVSSR